MTIDSIGYGAGDRDFDKQANVLRLVVGDAIESDASSSDSVLVLETNLDDVTAEIIGHCAERVMAAGALDCFSTPIFMKKGRPATKLSVICAPHLQGQVESLLFAETGTLGIRRLVMDRTILARESVSVETEWGPVAGKVATLPDGERQFSPEYDACQAVAEKYSLPLAAIMLAARQAYTGQA